MTTRDRQDMQKAVKAFVAEEVARQDQHRAFYDSPSYHGLIAKITHEILEKGLSYLDGEAIGYHPKNYSVTADEFWLVYGAAMQHARENKLETDLGGHFPEYVYKTPQLYFHVIQGQGAICRIWSPADWETDYKLWGGRNE